MRSWKARASPVKSSPSSIASALSSKLARRTGRTCCSRSSPSRTERRGDRLDVSDRRRQIRDRATAGLQDQPECVARRFGGRHFDHRAALIATADGEQSFVFEDPECLTHGRTADAELLQELVLLGKQIAVAELRRR